MNKYTEPNYNNAALITIDTQCDTLNGQPLEIPGTSDILPNMQRLLNVFRAKNKPIVHIIRIYKEDGSNVDSCRRKAIEGGARWFLPYTDGCSLAPELLASNNIKLDYEDLLSGKIQWISSNEVVIYKPRWGAFYNTPLEKHLRKIGISTLIFTGCNFPNCPRTSIYEASERDFRIVLIEDAISGLYDQGKKEMKNISVSLCDTELVSSIILAIDKKSAVHL